MLVKIQNANMIRDTESMALINTDNNEKNEYYSKVRMLKTQKDEINKVKSELEEMRSDMKEIKSLMQQLLNIKG